MMNRQKNAWPLPCPPIPEDPRLARIRDRDPTADGVFWYSVATTGVYCRPSCPSRHANPGNIRFHASPAEARAAGFRPCQRCHPDETGFHHAALIEQACRSMDRAEIFPSLPDLARQAGLSPGHFHRLFRAATGLTPAAYAQAVRADRARAALSTAETVTEAVYDSGFSSGGRFYERAGSMFGMTPTSWRAGGKGEIIRFALGTCSLGAILIASTERGLCSVLLGDDPQSLSADLRRRFPNALLSGSDPAYDRIAAQVIACIENGTMPDLPLDLRGTIFRQRVWAALRDIPSGATTTYAELAARLGSPGASRAVGSACAANPLAVIVPCHRVVRRSGDLAGYRWGLARKRALLDREAVPEPCPESDTDR